MRVPTLPANVTVAPRAPLLITPMPSSDQQDPPPGSNIPAGSGYKKNDVMVTALGDIATRGTTIQIQIVIRNNSAKVLLVLWKNSYVHLRDDKGRVYRRYGEGDPGIDENKQASVGVGNDFRINWPEEMWLGCCDHYEFVGPIDPQAKYLVLTVDQIVGMTNLNWRFNIQ